MCCPHGSPASLLSLSLNQIYCHSIFETLTKAVGRPLPAYLSNRCTCEFLRRKNSRLECSGRNKSFSFPPLLFFGGVFLCLVPKQWGYEWVVSLVKCSGESRDKLRLFLTPSLGYLWFINWTEEESCWHSGGFGGRARPGFYVFAWVRPSGLRGMSENESAPRFSSGLLPVYWRTTEHSSEKEREMDSRTLSALTHLVQNPGFALPHKT